MALSEFRGTNKTTQENTRLNTDFWLLNWPYAKAREMAEWDPEALDDLKSKYPDRRVTEVLGNPFQRPEGVLLPVILKSRRIRDFVWTVYSDCLIQEHVLAMFRKRGLSGFEAFPTAVRQRPSRRKAANDVETHDVAGLPTLWELAAVGWGGMARPESGIRLKEELPGGSRFYSGITDPSRLIDGSQWDGSDFFIVYPIVRCIFVTDRVARLVAEERLTGVELVPVSEMPTRYTDTVISAAGLRHCLPEERAREIGEPLGIY